MATKQEIISRAKEIIASQPSAGKSRVNTYLKIEFGVGLRSSTILTLKAQVAKEQPRLAPELYRTGGTRPTYRAVYNKWVRAGFIPYEARELTLGGGRLSVAGAEKVLNSIPGQSAIKTRQDWINRLHREGYTKRQIRQFIVDDYNRRLGTLDKHGKPYSPWTHVRDEYRPKPKVSRQQYKDMTESRRIKAKQRREYRQHQKELRHPLSDKRQT